MSININKAQLFIFIICIIITNLVAFYTGMHLGEFFKIMEIESRSLLPPSANLKISIPFPNLSSFKNLSSVSEKETLSKKNKFYIQVGAFKDINNAKKMAEKLEKNGFSTEIKAGKLNFLLVVGEGDEKEEKKVVDRLKKEGIKF